MTFTLMNTSDELGYQMRMETFVHSSFGTKHFHLKRKTSESAFLISFPTLPENDSGAAHVLEHLVLSGSDRFPVKSPFFHMNGRSLNSYLNAFTTADSTSFAFATSNEIDYKNLMEVMLDLTFFPNLDYLDFLQEGCRLEFSSLSDSSKLIYKGIVLNEMKSDECNVDSMLWREVCRNIFPDSPYKYVSGGTSGAIKKLTYDELTRFHREHYIPENAIVMTCGSYPANFVHTALERNVLQKSQRTARKYSNITLQPRFSTPKVATGKCFPTSRSSRGDSDVNLIVAWLLGDSAQLESSLEASLVRNLIAGHPSSTLRYAINRSGIGLAESPLFGLERSYKEMVFACGVQGALKDQEAAFTSVVMDALSSVAESGFSETEVEAALRKLELEQRTLGGDSVPFGLQLIMRCLPVIHHGGEPEKCFDVLRAISKLRQQCNSPSFIQNLLKKLVVNNPHRVTVALEPDSTLLDERNTNERIALDRIQSKLTKEDVAAIIVTTERLVKRQKRKVDFSILPAVTRSDISVGSGFIKPQRYREKISGGDRSEYICDSNGVANAEILFEVPEMDDKSSRNLYLFSQIVTKLGVNGKSQKEIQTERAISCGKFDMAVLCRAHTSGVGPNYFLATHASFLNTVIPDGGKSLEEAACGEVDFDKSAISGILHNITGKSLGRIAANGHAYAMGAASRNFNQFSRYRYESAGLHGLKKLANLSNQKEMQHPDYYETFQVFDNIRTSFAEKPRILLHVGDEEAVATLNEQTNGRERNDQPDDSGFRYPVSDEVSASIVWKVPEMTFHCCRSWPAPSYDTLDSVALSVLGKFLQLGFLHSAVREAGGAYGSGALNEVDTGAFHIFSYRDPRSSETFEDFSRALQWLQQDNLSDEVLDQAVLGAIKALDKPLSPATEARVDFHCRLFGRDPEVLQRRRERVRNITFSDLQAAANKFLVPEKQVEALVAPSSFELSDFFSNTKWNVRSI